MKKDFWNDLNLARSTPAGLALYTSSGNWKLAKHLQLLNRKLMDVVGGRTKRLVVSMPPRHGKSQLISKTLPAWYLGTFPDRKVIFSTYEQHFANEHGSDCRDIIEEHGEELFGITLKSGSSAASRWGIENRNGYMYSVGVGGGITGKGANLFVIDDVVKNQEEAESLLQKDKIWNWFGCFTEDVEYITEKGPISVKDLTKDIKVATVNPYTRELTYEYPTELFEYNYSGEIIYYDKKFGPSFSVTPNHSMFIYTNPMNPGIERITAEDLPDIFYIPQTFRWKGEDVSDFIKLEKSILSRRKFVQIYTDILINGYWDNIDENWILYRSPFTYNKNDIETFQEFVKELQISVKRIEKYKYTIKDKILNKELNKYKNNIISKNFHKDIKSLPPKYLEVILPYFNNKETLDRVEIFCSENTLYNDLIEILLKLTYRIKTTTKENRQAIIAVKCQDTKIEKTVHKREYNGKVYCCTVPSNNTVLIRYNGHISLSGNSVAYTRLEAGDSAIIVIGTRWSADDIIGRILTESKEKWDYLKLPAIAEEDEPEFPIGMGRKKGEALWPEMWPLEKLETTKNSGVISSYTWAALFQQSPVPAGGGLFKEEWFKYYTRQGDYFILKGAGNSAVFVDIKKCWLFSTIDTASKAKNTSDFSCICIWAVTEKKDLILVDLMIERLNYDQLLKEIVNYSKLFPQVRYFGIENMGIGIALISECRNRGLATRELEPGGRGKQNRANMPLGAVIRMESGKIFFPDQHKYRRELEIQLLTFPKGAHDDAVDCVSYAANELTKIDAGLRGDFMPYSFDELLPIGIRKAGNMNW